MKTTVLGLLLIVVVSAAWAQSTLRLGINFPMRNPQTASVPIYMNLVKESGAQISRQLTFGDVIWKQVEPVDNQWNFVYSDSVFLGYPEGNYVGNLYGITLADTLGFQVPWRACTDKFNTACRWTASRDSTDTKQYLETVIKRYGQRIRYWEIGNEIENGNYPAGLPAPQLAAFYRYNYNWIRSYDPDAKVIMTSFVGTYGVPFSGKYDWLRTMFTLGAGQSIDIIGYHDYNSWWTLPLHIDSILAIRAQFGLQSKPVWLTESSVSSNHTSITPAYTSDDEQAADVWRRCCLAWAKGADAYFWHSLWSSAPPSEWQEFGLVSHQGQRKKSFFSYQLLSQTLINFTSASIIQSGTITDDNSSGGNGIWVIKVEVNGKTNWVMWSPNEQSYTFTSSTKVRYQVIHVVPSTISADGLSATFKTDTISIQAENSYTFNLTSLPILVSEKNPTTSIESVHESPNTGDFLIYPNPGGAFLMFQDHNLQIQPFSLSFYTILGEEIYHYRNLNQSATISTQNWKSGLYFYTITQNDQKIRGKIMIIH